MKIRPSHAKIMVFRPLNFAYTEEEDGENCSSADFRILFLGTETLEDHSQLPKNANKWHVWSSLHRCSE